MKYKTRLSTTISLPPPTGGWNARDNYALMDVKDAVRLENWWPLTTDVMFRLGYTQYAYGFASQVDTVMWYSSGIANKLFAIEGSMAWDISAGGDYTAGVPDLTGLSNARWQYINITTPGGSFLEMVNGADKLRGYDGTNWYTDGDGSHDITGFNTATATNINLHKNRVWFTEAGTLKAYYMPTGAISGAATAFDLSSIARNGGYLMAMATWTIDAGYGVDDLAAWITSNGEVIIYHGTDPASIATWALVGVFNLGSPIGRRCMMKFGGDLLIMTQDGIVPMAQGLQSSRLDPRVNLTDKIQQAASNAATVYSGNFGWQLLYYAKQNMLIMNVPFSEGDAQQQYCMNTISKAWCNFTNVNANCWELYNDDPYFGGNGYVAKFWNGFSDYTTQPTATNINVSALQAFNYCGSSAQKHFRMIRPILNSSGFPSTYINLNVDFDLSDTTAPLSYSSSGSYVWDTALWDAAIWGGGLQILKGWQGANPIGFCAGVQFKGTSQGIETHWMATDVEFAKGGVL
jgi:hypothetical protein